ncbi:MAG: 1-deoxy-D-xylulose-5-phosphate reductoisomerase [Acidobacteriota bacterium]
MKKLSILGSTGSIGESALSLVDLYPDRFEVAGLAAGRKVDRLYQQACKYRPSVVALHDRGAADRLREQLPRTRVLGGPEGVIEVAVHPDADMVVAGITGAAGLLPTYHSILEHKQVALANKEALVMAGELIMPALQHNGGHLLPVDSEHSALHQCLRGDKRRDVRRLILTASGGPFLRKSKSQLGSVTVQEALQHPTWQMGPKITVDSATLMNKGLEIIEAHHLFGMASRQLSIVIHPQSVVHSMVEFIDGNVLAQLSITDMRAALLYALSYPQRWASNLPSLDLFSIPSLEFSPPDLDKFPCVRLASESLESGKTYPAVLNAANEVAVEFFLEGQIGFTTIPEVVEEVLNRHRSVPITDIDTVLEADREARGAARRAITRLTR